MAFDLGLGTLIGSGVSAIAGLFGQKQGNDKALEAVELQNQGNRELAEYAYEKNLEMWNRQNVYNSPVEQIQRLKDAGLNPNIIYGNGSASTGNASNPPSYNAPQLQAYTDFGDFGASRAGQALMNGLQNYAQLQKTEEEINFIRQNTQNLEAETQYKYLRNEFQLYQNAKSKTEKEYYERILLARLENIYSNTSRNIAQTELTNSQNEFTINKNLQFEALMPLIYQKTETDVKQAIYNLNVMSPAKLSNLVQDTRYKEAITILSNLKSDALNIELNYKGSQELAKSLISAHKADITLAEKKIKEALANYGVRPDGKMTELINGIIYNLIVGMNQ